MNHETHIWAVPAEGRLVRLEDPSAGHVPPEGMPIPTASQYYARRLAAGDLVLGTPPAPSEPDADPAPRRSRRK